MIQDGLWIFHNKRVLLLQGPVGPFFWRLSRDLQRAGASVVKVNFNGGDILFYPKGAVTFRRPEEEWPAFLNELISEHEIDSILLFGDCRPLHRTAHAIALRKGLEIGVFEEGYIRPNYISFERLGVNANSVIPREPQFYLQDRCEDETRPLEVGNVFWHAMTWAMLYNTIGQVFSPLFPQYRHHRSFTIFEGLLWLRSFWRKQIFALREKGIQHRLATELSHKYFLVPLQLNNDAQIWVHSEYASIEDFIEHVIASFAERAPSDIHLVLKQHPFDRGLNDYAPLIESLAAKYQLGSRLMYIHDQHLPTLLRHTLGVILINSTVGLSALRHGVPLKVCGKAVYDMEGMTFQGSLDEFWTNHEPPSKELVRRFNNYLIKHTQINGNFYKRLPILRSFAGICWEPIRKRTLQVPSWLPRARGKQYV